MAVIQEMCARIGLVTKEGLSGTLRKYYPKYILYIVILFSFPAIVFNIGADIAAMGAVSNMLFPGIHSGFFSIFFTIIIITLIILFPYKRIASILKWLCLSLFAYLLVPFFTNPSFKDVIAHTLIPHFSFDSSFIAMLVGILGTTISPYLFFWQTSMEVEEMGEREILVDKKTINTMRTDVYAGMFFSNLVMYFIILSAGTALKDQQILTVDQAANALQPVAGTSAYLLFAIGIIGTGFLAIPVLAGSLSYMMAETFQWQEGFNKKYTEAKGFYRVIIVSMLIALAINFIGISPVTSLLYTAILYGITAPVLILILIFIGNNKKVMGKYTNSFRSNLAAVITLTVMTASAVALIVLSV